MNSVLTKFNKDISSRIFFTSDTHFGHNKEFLYQPRGFDSIEEHDSHVIKNWNSIVDDDDIVFHLGDMMLGNSDYGIECLKKLKGNIILIRGNHDTDNKIELYKQLPNFTLAGEALTIKVGKQHYFLSHYPSICANYDDKPLTQHLINLFGHTHQKEKFYNDNPFMYHVGMDSNNNFPVTLTNISIDIHDKVEELYKQRQQNKDFYKWVEDYQEGMKYFETHPLGEEILD